MKELQITWIINLINSLDSDTASLLYNEIIKSDKKSLNILEKLINNEYIKLSDNQINKIKTLNDRQLELILLTSLKSKFYYQSQISESRLVCTLDDRIDSKLESTKDTITNLLNSAKKSIYIFGFWYTKRTNYIVDILKKRMKDGVKVIFLVNDEDNFLNPLIDNWGKDKMPSIYLYLQNISEKSLGIMHAKTIVIDEKSMFITSANLTGKGMEENLEIGVIIKNGHVPEEMSKLINRLIHNKNVFRKVY